MSGLTCLGVFFDGCGDVNDWICAMDPYFEEKGVLSGRMLEIVMEFFSQDVHACVDSVRTSLEKVTEKEWVWTWLKLKHVLREMQKQIEFYKKEADTIKRKKILKGLGIAGIGIAAGFAFTPLVLGVLGAVGFGAAGVAAGSAAAGIQAGIGNVAAGSFFAFCQSAAAGGAVLASISATGAVAGTTIGIGGTAASAAQWELIRRQMPSYSWKDGEKFKPSPELIVALVQFPSLSSKL